MTTFMVDIIVVVNFALFGWFCVLVLRMLALVFLVLKIFFFFGRTFVIAKIFLVMTIIRPFLFMVMFVMIMAATLMGMMMTLFSVIVVATLSRQMSMIMQVFGMEQAHLNQIENQANTRDNKHDVTIYSLGI
jgi:hypothetical protein